MKLSVLAAAAALALPGLPGLAQPAQKRQSQYTSLDACVVVETAREEAGYSRAACPGVGGYRLEYVVADARDNLVVIAPDGAEESLRLPSLMGGAFSTIRPTIEWRGVREGGALRPDALIVRYEAFEDPDRPERPTSYLLVISLAGTPCLAARIAPMAGQNEEARIAADGPMRCLEAPAPAPVP
jgi:hypothetical protein